MSKMQKPKSRLGRGLSSLISVSALPVEAEVEAGTPASPSGEAGGDHAIASRVAPATDERDDVTALPASIQPVPAHPLAAAKLQSDSFPPSLEATQTVTKNDVPRGTPETPSGSPVEIPTGEIAPNPHQPRRQFNDVTLAELAASLKSNGLIQPIVVRRVESGFELVAGERRLRAAKLAGMSAIPAIVRELDSFNQAQMALVENIHREDLNPIERATAYRALIDQLGLTQAELANRLGEDRSSVTNFLRLLELAEPVRAMLRDGTLSLGHAKVLAGVSDVLEQGRLGNLVAAQGLSVRNLERLVQSPMTPPAARAGKPGSSPHLQDLEKSFARQLGMRVQIRSGANKGKGRVVIHYASLDQFDQILEKLGVETEST